MLSFLKIQSGADDVKRHRWFKGIDWQEVVQRKLTVSITSFKNQ